MALFSGTPIGDIYYGGDEADTIFGYAGRDTLVGYDGHDSLDGGADGDFLYGGRGNDTLRGGDGYDELAGNAGDDLLDGGGGQDFAIYDQSPSAVSINLTTGVSYGGGGQDTLIGIEHVDGSQFDDLILGDAQANILFGNGGTDTLIGGEGSDTLMGDFGSDLIEGGEGMDLAGYEDSRSLYTVSVYGTGFLVSRPDHGTDTISGVERFGFDHGVYAIVTEGPGQQAAQLLGTLMGAAAPSNKDLMGETLAVLDHGFSIDDAATRLVSSTSFASIAGSHSHTDFINTIYFNLTGAYPDQVTRESLVALLQNGNYSQAQIAVIAAGFHSTTDIVLAYTVKPIPGSWGTEAGETIYGGSGSDLLAGHGGNDVMNGQAGNDFILGGDGIDTALYSGSKSGYQITTSDVGVQVVTLANGEIDALNSIERVRFDDVSLAFDIAHGNAGTVAKIVGAMFGLTGLADKVLVGECLDMLDAGMTKEALAGVAAASYRFGNEAGGHGNQQFAERIYFNIAGFKGSPEAIAPIVALLETHSQAQIGALAAEISYNADHIDLVGLAQTGLGYLAG